MANWQNYRPVTSEEHYLERIAKAVEELVAQKKGVQATEGLTPLREAQPQAEYSQPATPLPDDYPGKDALEAAGVVYVESVPKTGNELTAISGIGSATANKILTYQKTNG